MATSAGLNKCRDLCPTITLYRVIIVAFIQFLVVFAQGQGPGSFNHPTPGEPYHFYIDENVPVGTRVGNITVEAGSTVYISSRTSLPDHVNFALDEYTGVVVTAKPLDRENLKYSNKPIIIVVLTQPPSHSIEMKITVRDKNDNPPTFPKPSYAIRFAEESDDNNKLMVPLASDRDKGKNSLITNYTIISGNQEGKFALIQEPPYPQLPRILYIQNRVKLNREEKEFYQLNISAIDHGSPPMVGFLLVNITVADINDNYPTFHMSVYAANVNETAPPGTTVIQVEASDLDQGNNKAITYSIETNKDSSQFEIDRYTGVVTTTRKLSCHQNTGEKMCFLILLATDNGPEHLTGRAYLNVHIIDQNDHAPVIEFQHQPDSSKDYSAVNENAVNGTYVTIITVNDLDDGMNGNVSLSIIDGNQLGHFRLIRGHKVSVLVVVNNLDREKVHVYNLTLLAVDMGEPPLSSTAHLVIYVNDINDHPPKFDPSKYFAVLSETIPVGSFVTAVTAKDSDFGLNSQITYTIISGNKLGWFSINSRTGLLVTVATLDYEVSSVVILNISAQDGGFKPYKEYTTVNITLLDINDMPPTFSDSSFKVEMEEELPFGEEIITVRAEDRDLGLNGTLRYMLHTDVIETYPETFHINSTSGRLTTIKSLDREEEELYVIKVVAYDIGEAPLSSTCTVFLKLLDINDNRPVFYPVRYYPKLQAKHSENSTVIKVTAIDKDSGTNGRVTYELTGGDVASFYIDLYSGVVFVKGRLDASVQTHYKLTVSAQDGNGKTASNTATVLITIPSSENAAPFFLSTPYVFSVTEDNEAKLNTGQIIGYVIAKSNEQKPNISLSIIDGDPEHHFLIDYLGNLRTAKKIDREHIASYNIRVLAASNGNYAEVGVKITVIDRNDNRPKFETAAVDVEVFENWSVGKEVYQVSATDLDEGINANISYTLHTSFIHPFMIRDSGMIYINHPLERLTSKIYQLNVVAVDAGNPQLSSSQTVRIHVMDVNDHTPVFSSAQNSISLLESQPINDRFFLISATDADEGRNKEIVYRISRGSEDGKFAIFPDGHLYIAEELDRETKDFYHLTIVAEDRGVPHRSSSANVTIQILDANDKTPVFGNKSYSMSIEENKVPNSYVGSVHATDADIGRNAELAYYISTKQDNFAVNVLNGRITSLKAFDREKLILSGKDYYTFEVIVKDNGMRRLQSSAKVRVTIKDVNDNAPEFKKPLYRASVVENARPQTLITQVSAVDADLNENQFLTYAITDGDQNNTFSINSRNGQIQLDSALDRETIDTYLLTVVAYDSGSEVQLSSYTKVHIIIHDYNDNPPTFRSPPMSIELIETVIPGTRISQFQATDEDLGNNALLTFSIIDGNPNDTFHVDGKTGNIYVMEHLDYEVQKVYHLNISVSDFGVPALVTYQRFTVYVMDYNDNSPSFPETPNTFSIEERIKVGTVVGTVTANDPDRGINGEVRYRIASQSPPGDHFRIVNSGNLLVNRDIDYEKMKYSNLIVIATDNAHPTSRQKSSEKTVKIVVTDLNDNAPRIISPETFIISQDVPVNSEVGRVEALDIDSGENGRVTYMIISGNTSYFLLSRSTGIVTLKQRLPVGQPILQLTIQASDAGINDNLGAKSTMTTIYFIITSDNRSGPTFAQARYLASVPEDVPIGKTILTVEAKPNNKEAKINYYITRVDANNKGILLSQYFSVDKTSGRLTTKDHLDRDVGFTNIVVEICAVEVLGSSVAESRVQATIELLDVNDNPPHFNHSVYALELIEDFPVDFDVLPLVVKDPDTTGSFQLSITSGNDGTFTVSDSGILSLRNHLDRERMPHYNLHLSAFDGVHSATAMVQITILDINDNVPKFNKSIYTFDLLEDLPINSTIGSILAKDPDDGPNGTVSYHLLTDWGKEVFHLDPRTGTFTLKSFLDFEQVQLYSLLVSAKDHGPNPKSSVVTVYMNIKDINDNAPIFSPSSYTTAIFENATIGTSAIAVYASDADTGINSKLVYGITGGNQESHFTIDSHTGIISVNHSLDREQYPSYTLTVTAMDTVIPVWQRHSALAQVMILVSDVNDCSPRFTSASEIWVEEDAAVNTVVHHIQAIDDDDDGPNQEVRYSLTSSSGPFSIRSDDGSLRLMSSLDRESQDTYYLTVKATDGGTPALSSTVDIIVHVDDINDNNPVFQPKQYQANISESKPVGTILLRVTATDLDIGLNGMVRYFILEGDDNQDFSLDQSSGLLRIQKQLDYERKKSYHILIQCEDSGADPRNDTAAIYISIVDINDNAPVFVDSPFLAYVQENMETLPVHVTMLSARDDDSHLYSRLTYAIRDGDRNIFHINSTSGEVTASKTLDREHQFTYRLTVIATDSGSPPLTGTGTVNIEVQDINDNSPQFLQPHYIGYIEEHQLGNSSIVTVNAVDDDDGVNALIRYSLLSDMEGKFTIDPSRGTILATASFDREEQGQYEFYVSAEDAGYTPRTATAAVTVIVKDRNDNKPMFQHKTYNKYIYHPTVKGEFVFGITAVDFDIGLNGKVSYSLSGHDERKFKINSTTGVVMSNQNLYLGLGRKFLVYVTATDQGSNPLFSRAKVTIHMLQKDKSRRPRFTLARTEFKLEENSSVNTSVTRLSGVSPKGVPLKYFIAGGNINNAFGVDPQRNVLTIANKLDYEETHYYGLWIGATDTSRDALTTYKEVHIFVIDVNDNAPYFDQLHYYTKVEETNEIGKRVLCVSAKDADSGRNGMVSYKITKGNSKNAFQIRSSGCISTRNQIDRETIDFYQLVIKAVDQSASTKKTGTTTVDISVLDIDDNPPRFTRLFTASIPENSEIGSFILQLSTEDQDIGENAEVTYALLENSGNKFSLEPLSGNISVRALLDVEKKEYHKLKVAARTSSHETSTYVTIKVTDINDNAPQFTMPMFMYEISELQVPPIHVGKVAARDSDRTSPNNKFYYSLKMPSLLFNITDKTGEIFTTRQLHYDNTSLYNHHELTVVATDLGVPSRSSESLVVINVIDDNDNPPRFEKTYYFSAVPYNLTVGDPIIKVLARDDKDYGMNAQVEYIVVEGNGTNYFYVNKADGTVHLSASLSQSMDKEFQLKVQAVDKGRPPQSSDIATIHLKVTDINKYPPLFLRIVFEKQIPENFTVNGIFDTVQAIDHDHGPNQEVSYYITGGNPQNLFSISEKYGNLSVSKALDYDTTTVHRLNITARDHGLYYKETSIIFTIFVTDINDNPPVFDRDVYDVYVHENSPIGSSIFKLSATDADSGSYAIIEYQIVGDNRAQSMFVIDHKTKTINSTSSLDYESEENYSLHILAKNPGTNLQSIAVVNVHLVSVNEYNPVFIQNEYNFSISESVQKGTSVGAVLATDRDSGPDGIVYYFLMDSSNLRGFKINPLSGVITVSGKPDYESQPHITLDVMAKNWGSVKGNDTVQCKVRITITDANDAPVFLQSLYLTDLFENNRPGALVIRVKAFDNDLHRKDHQFNYTILSGNLHNAFNIDSTSGQISVASTLDRESVALYQLKVGAIDKGIPPQTGTTAIRIRILDVNDCPPIFTNGTLVASVAENVAIGSSVISLADFTEDCDLPPNTDPFYFFQDHENYKEYVKISSTGLVTTNALLDREKISKFSVSVSVTDNGAPTMTARLSFTVLIQDVNDSPSKPRKLNIQLSLFQRQAPSQFIGDVKPLDNDITGDYSCRILQMSAEIFKITDHCYLEVLHEPETTDHWLTISGHDGIHSEVVYNVSVDFAFITNETLKDSLTIKFVNLTEKRFLTKYYSRFLKNLKNNLESDWDTKVFSIKRSGDDLDVFVMASDQNGNPVSRHLLQEVIADNQNKLRQGLSSTMILDQSLCSVNPCYNGGSCIDQLVVIGNWNIIATNRQIMSGPNITDFICQCPVGYTGTLCQIQETQCGEVYCHNGGTCVIKSKEKSYCHCLVGWTGASCTKDVNECEHNPCQNGICENIDGSFKCVCQKGFIGKLCETGINYCEPNRCQNGSVCISNLDGFVCECPYNKWGKYCSKSSYRFEELSFLEFPTIAENYNNITVHLATKLSNALLLYNPVNPSLSQTVESFIALEIINGQVQLSISTGSASLLNLYIPYKVNDGKWYKVELLRIRRNVHISVHACSSTNQCHSCDGSKTCSNQGELKYENLQLHGGNLYIGGIPAQYVIRSNQVRSHDFIGCMRSFIVNGVDMIQLEPRRSSGIKKECLRHNVEGPCESNPCQNGGVCVDRWTTFKCQCPPQYMGKTCQNKWKPFSFGPGARVEFNRRETYYRDEFLKSNSRFRKKRSVLNANTISIKFRTLKKSGLLWYADNKKKYILLMVNNSQPLFLAGNTQNRFVSSALLALNVSVHSWYTISVHIEGDSVTVEGDNNKKTQVFISNPLDISSVDVEVMFLANTKHKLSVHQQTVPGFEGCLENFFLNGEKMPFDGSTDRFDVSAVGNVSSDCSSLCAANPCGEEMICEIEGSTYKCLPYSSVGIGLLLKILLPLLILLILILTIVGLIVFWRRRRRRHVQQQHNKTAKSGVLNKFCSQRMNNSNSKTSSQTYSEAEYVEGNGIPDEIIIRNHILEELAQKAHDNSCMPRPDIIESESHPVVPLEMEDGTIIIENGDLSQSVHLNEDIPEHYDLENASSIAPSDIDIVTHYKGFRDGKINKYKPNSNLLNYRHPYVANHQQNMMWSGNMPASNALNYNGPLSVPAHSSPMHLNNLARSSPAPVGIRQSPMNLLSHQSPSTMTPSLNNQWNCHSASSDNCTGKPGKSKPKVALKPQPAPRSSSNNHSRGNRTKGFSVEEVNRLNACPDSTNPGSIRESLSSSDENIAKWGKASDNLNNSALMDGQDSSSNDSANDSFTCSEFEYDTERVRNDFEPGSMIYSKLTEVENENDESPVDNRTFDYDGLDSAGESYSTLVSSDEDKSKNRGTVGSFDLDYLLTWGPNFEKLVGVFKDIASLPDSEAGQNLQPEVVNNVGAKSDEEYV